MNVLDSITKAPSQVLVKSATNFGQDAAKIIGAYAEECVKNSTNDILHEIRESTERLCEMLKETFSGLGNTVHQTGVEAFTEWGIGIERAFLHLGQKLETGLTNSTNRAAYALRDTVDETVWNLRKTIHNSTTTFADAVSQFGLKHAEVYKYTFRYEIMGMMFSGLLISISFCIFSISVATKLGMTRSIFSFLSEHFVAICFLIFALLNAYVIHVSSQHSEFQDFSATHIRNTSSVDPKNLSSSQSAPQQKSIGKRPGKKTINKSKKSEGGKMSRNSSGQSLNEEVANEESRDKIQQTAQYHKGNGLIPYLIVASIGYMGGNLSTQIFTFSSLNFLLSFIIMTIVTLIAYRILAFNLILKLYRLYKHFKEFGEYLKEKRESQREMEAAPLKPFISINRDGKSLDVELEPDSAISRDGTMWSEEDEFSEGRKLRHRETSQERLS